MCRLKAMGAGGSVCTSPTRTMAACQGRGPCWQMPNVNVRPAARGRRGYPRARATRGSVACATNIAVAIDPDRQLFNGQPATVGHWIDALVAGAVRARFARRLRSGLLHSGDGRVRRRERASGRARRSTRTWHRAADGQISHPVRWIEVRNAADVPRRFARRAPSTPSSSTPESRIRSRSGWRRSRLAARMMLPMTVEMPADGIRRSAKVWRCSSPGRPTVMSPPASSPLWRSTRPSGFAIRR